MLKIMGLTEKTATDGFTFSLKVSSAQIAGMNKWVKRKE